MHCYSSILGSGTEKMIITGTPTEKMVKLEFTYVPKDPQGSAKEVAFFYFNQKDGEHFKNIWHAWRSPIRWGGFSAR